MNRLGATTAAHFRARAVVAGALLFVAPLVAVPAHGAGAAATQPHPRPTATSVDRDGNGIADTLDERIHGLAPGEKVKAVVQTDRRATPALVRAHERAVGRVAVHNRYRHVDAYAAELAPAQVERLAARPDVVRVDPELTFEAAIDTATADFGVDTAAGEFGVDGSGITIAVVDTGLRATHEQLDGGKVVKFLDFVSRVPDAGLPHCDEDPSEPAAYDDNGHGTHVASIAAGDGVGGSSLADDLEGVAPAASLVGLKVLDSAGSGSTCDVDDALEWVLDHHDDPGEEIDVVNLSLGSSFNGDGTDTTSQLVDQLAAAGVVVTVAASNDGPGAGTVRIPGVAADGITVGAMSDPTDFDDGDPLGFGLADFSSRGPTSDNRVKPDVVAPGVDIAAASAGSNTGYALASGTSMAAPFAAGVAALMLEADPTLTPADVKTTLMATAEDWGAAGTDHEYGAGRLDAYAAVDDAHLLAGAGGPAVPAHVHRTGTLSGTGDADVWTLDVQDDTWPVAVTMIRTSGSGDLDIRLCKPDGSLVEKSTAGGRQETLGESISGTGNYILRVSSSSGSGNYWLDTSGPVDVAGPSSSSSCPVPPPPTTTTTTTSPPTTTTTRKATTTTTAPKKQTPAPVSPTGAGYYLFDRNGGVFAFGKGAKYHGSIPALRAAGHQIGRVDVVAGAPVAGGNGYLLFDEIGGVFAFGEARYHGSIPHLRANGVQIGQSKVVDAIVTHGGAGYLLFDEQGGVFAFGRARFLGSIPGLRASGIQVGLARVVAASVTNDGDGYLLFDEYGGVFAFGKARYHGSVPALQAAGAVTTPVRLADAAVTGNGSGYLLVESAGGVFAFGTARYRGSIPSLQASGTITGPVRAVAVTPTGDGAGYHVVGDLGGVYGFGRIPYHGSILDLRAAGHAIGPVEIVDAALL